MQAFADQAAIALENSRLYSELHRVLRTVEESQERLVRGERLRALGEMAAGVAHDFNNALAIIVSRAEVLLDELPEPGLRRQIDVVIKVAEDAAQTVRRIQEFTRTRRARPFQRVDLNQAVDEVLEVTRSRWEDAARAQGIRYVVAVEPGPAPIVAGDPSEIREALTNLFFNALDAMPSGGRVVLRTGTEGDRVFCAVTDAGVGMTGDVKERIFEPFFTTKEERGTGLGLSVVYGIMARHGGEVDVVSRPGAGSTFTMRLPLSAETPAPAVSPAPSPRPRRGRILVIDDETDIRETLRDMLVRDGHDVVACADGESGLAHFVAEGFDLVITDLVMPRTTGWDVARLVKQRSPATTVVMVTGWGDHFDRDEAEGRGVDALIAKPFRRLEVREVVAAALSRGGSPADVSPS
jgi:nitrogen-specific signal transduction histidine kinase/CheY-like chemotaxis protein